MDAPAAGHCLNCAAELQGPFCAACGQRAVPRDPTVAELAGDAWHELTGYDGRIAETVRALLRPGKLTTDYLDGQRARYLSPVRLYLIVSVVYFVVAAAAPEVRGADGRLVTGPGIRIDMSSPRNQSAAVPDAPGAEPDDPEQAPWMLRPIMRAAVKDPAGLRARIFTTMPRVFFGMLPVFAAIVGLFYRGRRFPTHLVFAVHLHALVFAVATVSELAKFTGSLVAGGIVGAVVSLALAAYVLLAFRAVYGGTWVKTIAKTVGIGLLYLIVAIPAFFITLAWAAVG